ncbi:MAG: HAD family hydrolase [Planctomycetota bacterium]
MSPAAQRRYDLLAVDIDGTLLDPQGNVPQANIDAIARARDAGMAVLLCTGRSWAESRFAIEATGVTHPMVSAGGSMVSDTATGGTLHRFAMQQDIVGRTVDLLTDRGLAALVLKDRSVSEHDYLVVTRNGATIDPVSTWWFETLGLSYTVADSIDDDEHPEWTVRVGACAPSTNTIPIRDELFGLFGEGVVFHSFPAVVAPEHVKHDGAGGLYHVVEAFDPSAHKWSGIEGVCGELGIDPTRTVCVGDEINDLTMIERAGLGIAMGNATDEVKRLAGRQTLSNAESGLAHAIDRVLAGRW